MSSRGRSKVNVVTVVVAALAGLGAGFALVMLTSGDSSGQPDLASMAQVDLSEAPEEVSEPTTPETPPAEAPGTSETPPDSTTGSVLASCAQATALADAAVAAARTSLGNWETHYGAQIAFDNGEIDGAEAKRRWAESKEPAQRNIDAFRAAREALPTDDPCATVDAEALENSERRQARRCAARGAAVADVMADAQPALDDWLAHLEMMATRDQYAIDEYLAIWTAAVADAPAAMRAFAAASGAYDDLGDCGPARAALEYAPVAVVSMGAGTDPAAARIQCVLTSEGRRQVTTT